MDKTPRHEYLAVSRGFNPKIAIEKIAIIGITRLFGENIIINKGQELRQFEHTVT